MSQKHESKWDNTLAAQRKQKENARIERANKREKARLEIDAEEVRERGTLVSVAHLRLCWILTENAHSQQTM